MMLVPHKTLQTRAVTPGLIRGPSGLAPFTFRSETGLPHLFPCSVNYATFQKPFFFFRVVSSICVAPLGGSWLSMLTYFLLELLALCP